MCNRKRERKDVAQLCEFWYGNANIMAEISSLTTLYAQVKVTTLYYSFYSVWCGDILDAFCNTYLIFINLNSMSKVNVVVSQSHKLCKLHDKVIFQAAQKSS